MKALAESKGLPRLETAALAGEGRGLGEVGLVGCVGKVSGVRFFWGCVTAGSFWLLFFFFFLVDLQS